MNPRIATASDALGISSVQVSAWQAAYRGLMDQALLDSLCATGKVRSWEEFIAAPGQLVLVVEVDSQVTGYAHACDSRDEPRSLVGEIASMYVAPTHWRKGLGSALLCAAEHALAARGNDTVMLWVLEANDRARAFYERFGYSPDGASKRHPKSGLTEVRYRRAQHAAG